MRRVAIIGLGRGYQDAPKDWERWGLPWAGDSSYDRYFEIHATDVRPYTDEYIRRLNDLEVPVVMQEAMTGIPNSIAFPDAARELINNYMESSISYMLAMAIFEGVDEISIHGVGCPFDSHYVAQRSNLEYLIGFARGCGIQVHIDERSELCTSYWAAGVYGFDKNNLRPGTEYVQ